MRTYAQQKTGLTRAQKQGALAVARECARTVSEWSDGLWIVDGRGTQARPHCWPDDWARWQRALDDAVGWPNPVSIDDFVVNPEEAIACVERSLRQSASSW